uniref:Ovule protein n=1 Tax=Caenorhabditis tropicalis TaxID=1561998 RepID=A0A1I7T3V8_9PELO
MDSSNSTGKVDEKPTIDNRNKWSYSREKMLILNDSPICFLRPPFFSSVVLHLPELIRLPPSPDISDLLTNVEI